MRRRFTHPRPRRMSRFAETRYTRPRYRQRITERRDDWEDSMDDLSRGAEKFVRKTFRHPVEQYVAAIAYGWIMTNYADGDYPSPLWDDKLYLKDVRDYYKDLERQPARNRDFIDNFPIDPGEAEDVFDRVLQYLAKSGEVVDKGF